MDITQLNQDFGIDGSVVFTEELVGFPLIKIKNDFAVAAVSMYGGHVISYQPVGADHDLMYLSGDVVYKVGKGVRGGVPICWPWFGPHPTDSSQPSHGVARTSFWQVESTETTTTGATRIILKLTDSPETHELWDYSFELRIAVTVGKTLNLELITRNTGDQVFEITQALHTYFKIGDVDQVQVLGLDGCDYIDKVDGGQIKTQLGEVAIAAEVDRVYSNVPAELVINDPALSRKIKLISKNSTTAIVWNPWIDKSKTMGDFPNDDYKHMICVETANAAKEIITVPPQGEYSMAVAYQCEAY
ncbi:D-hexose-6-phosphate mutarotase [[Limnothrix rosea] IAM M-220]|uniref:D-hexose-6-phosphate mutarotase n=1 Tax=[Limnothrix rosea] IAM M-220 TaxID=454133 RepID=UPI00095FFCDE|nr:D-hexose-6-phosphate mutarotase [[Limnothrix rosea] IAM M-220]OKH18872.1 D-hexose-6-phosphate mutarotase [[Limnothrix rosea] IAM M-220]